MKTYSWQTRYQENPYSPLGYRGIHANKYNQITSWRDSKFPKDPHIIKEELIDFNHKKVIVIQRQENPREDRVIVPGYELKREEGISDVDPIEIDKREELENILREHKFKGEIKYW